MNVDEAIAVLRKKLRHVTREYRPEDQALDVIANVLKHTDLGRRANEHKRRGQEIIDLYRKAQEDNIILRFHLVMHD